MISGCSSAANSLPPNCLSTPLKRAAYRSYAARSVNELSNDVDGHEGFSHLRLWMSSGRCRWALIYLAFGTLTSINNFAAVTASKAGKEGTLKNIKKCLTVTRYR